MNRKFILFALLAAPVLEAAAQHLVATNPEINCGQVLFRRPVTVEYELKNTGSGSIKISNVRTDCGCTTVSFPATAIDKGATFVLKAVYDAKQMGHFEKQIGVYCENEKQPLMLTVKGVVVDEIVDFEGDYPVMLGTLKADRNDIEFDDVNRGDRPLQKIHLYNGTDATVQPVVMHLPNYLKAEVSPSKIAPGHAGVATITLDSRALRSMGLNQTTVYLGAFPGDKVGEAKAIGVSAVLLPDFSNLTNAQKERQPSLQLSAETLDLGAFDGKSKKKGEIILKNVGKGTL
ncbi:MAG TPA: DUF1573 domain-containing protein, partial [Prevotella sp.]